MFGTALPEDEVINVGIGKSLMFLNLHLDISNQIQPLKKN